MSQGLMDALRFLAQGRTQYPGLEDFDGPTMAQWGKAIPPEHMREMGQGLATPLLDPATKLNFEQRVLWPEKFPVLDNKDGSVSTHRMAWEFMPNGIAVYPTVVQNKAGALQQLGDWQAFDYAMRTGEYRRFLDRAAAEAYAEGGYKKSWGLGSQR